MEEAVSCLKKLIEIYHTVDASGNPTASIIEIVDTWIEAKEIVYKHESEKNRR